MQTTELSLWGMGKAEEGGGNWRDQQSTGHKPCDGDLLCPRGLVLWVLP